MASARSSLTRPVQTAIVIAATYRHVGAMAGEQQDESGAAALPSAPIESAAPAHEGPATVDIHKPKPVHNWREFLTEISTIICGILIALALEQGVETAHHQQEVREAREALHQEISDNIQAMAYGLREDDCLLAQVDSFARWARGGPRPAPLRTRLATYRSNVWETVKANAVPNMPLRERLELSKFYSDIENINAVVGVQRTSALSLFGTQEYAALTDTDSRRILDAVAIERAMVGFHKLNVESLIRRAGRLGVALQPLKAEDRAEIAQLCGKSVG